MLSSSVWCLSEQGFYYFFSGTRMDLKWVTTTVGSWCQFWQGGMHRIRGALVETLFADTDSDTDPSGGQNPPWSCKEREGMALPGAELSQLALLHCWGSVPSCPVRTVVHGQQWWQAEVQPMGHRVCLYWDTLGKEGSHTRYGAEHRLTSAQEWD